MNPVASFWRRNQVTILLSVIIICIFGIFGIQAFTNAQLAQQIERTNELIEETKHLAEGIEQNATDRSRQVNAIDRKLDCIVEFFAFLDRTDRTIEDIEDCTIRRLEQISDDSESNSEPPATSQPQSNTSTRQQPTTSTPPEPRQNAQPSQPEQPPQQPNQPPQNERGLIERTTDNINDFIRGVL
jgi:low affinity Fe/Cu permease